MAGSQGDGEGSGKKDITRWTPRMEEAYQAALEKVGGLDAAKPRALLDELQHEFPFLTLQACKWHLLAHRRRVERHKVMQPQGIAPPTKWTGRLEEQYEAAIARLGGLSAATPKPVFEALQADFPDLTLQHVKTHMQKQRRKEQRGGSGQASQSGLARQQSSSRLDRDESEEPPQQPAKAAAASAAAAAAFVGPSAAVASPAGAAPMHSARAPSPAAAANVFVFQAQDTQQAHRAQQQQQQQQQQHSLQQQQQQQQAPSPPPQQFALPPMPPQQAPQVVQWQAGPEQQPRLVSSSALQADRLQADLAALAAREQQVAAGDLSLVQQARLMLQAAGVQLPGSETLVGEPTVEDLQRVAAVQHAVDALSPHLLPAAQQPPQAQQPLPPMTEQQMQQVAALLLAELAPAAGLAAAAQMPPPPPQQPVPRYVPSSVPQSWHAQLLPAAQRAQLVASRQALHCRQCVVQLERQAEQLVELLQALRQSHGATSSGGGVTEERLTGTALAAQQAQQAGVALELIPFHLHKVVKRLAARASPVSSGKHTGTHATSRQQRHAARIASAFTVISGKQLQAQQVARQPQHAQHDQQQAQQHAQQQAQQAKQAQQGQQLMEVDQPGPPVPPPPRPGEWKLTHNPATCVIPGCPMCLFEERLGQVQTGLVGHAR